MGFLDLPKRLFVGRPVRSDSLGHTLLSKKVALPIFSSDALSSVSYATEEVLIVLGTAGLLFFWTAPWIAVGVVLLFAVISASYMQTVKEYPNGGGDYVVAHENVSKQAGIFTGAALLVDYVLTVAVSMSAGVYAIYSALPSLKEHRVGIALGLIAFVTLMNLRGVKEAGTFFAVPTYAFVVGILTMLAIGGYKVLFGDGIVAASSTLELHATQKTGGLLTMFFLLRAFSSGCTALTGVEAIANGVPSFKKPKAENASKTLLMMAVLAITMFSGITALALASDVRVSHEAHASVVSQIATAVFGAKSFGFYYIQVSTALILVLAANTAYQGFPVLSSILAQDRYLPRQLHNRGDRLVFSNGVLALAIFAGLLVYAFDAEVTRLIQLYIVGVFVAFTLGQAGMVRRWSRKLREEPEAARGPIQRSRLINLVGCATTAVVLVIVLISKFTHGAWIVVVAMPVIYLVMRGINSHYMRVAKELRAADTRPVLPSRMHAIVLVSQLHNPTLRALNYAKAIRPSTLQALYVSVDDEESQRLQAEWEEKGIDVPLVVRESPFRDVTGPILDYVRNFPRESERDVVTVIIPEFVVGKWWEQLLHNQSALLLKGRLLFQPGVTVTSVPWHLSSAPEPEEPVTVIAPK